LSAKLDSTLAALAEPARRGVVDLLRKKPRRAGELAAALEMSPAAMSRHLRVLRKTGLIRETALEDDARVRVYRLLPEPFNELKSWVEEVEAFWTVQLDSFKARAEARARGQVATRTSKGKRAQ
jgi:DNA-binding transcriptional ArsR family regulator